MVPKPAGADTPDGPAVQTATSGRRNCLSARGGAVWWALAATLAWLLPAATPAASPRVVINEIFYNAPNELDDLQWIELHNASTGAVSLAGWTLDDGKLFKFPADTTLASKGFLVVALNPARFAENYPAKSLGPLLRPLKRGGEKLSLKDASGQLVDSVRYKDRTPWPASPDGGSASLERICPTVGGEGPENWAASPLPPQPQPAGTPGRNNVSFAETIPPVVSVEAAPTLVAPGQPIPVTATVQGKLRIVELVYSVVSATSSAGERAITMTGGEGQKFRASLPAQSEGKLLRYRIRATGDDGTMRYFPDAQDLRPTLSAYVHGPWEPAQIPQAFILRGIADRSGPDGPRRTVNFGSVFNRGQPSDSPRATRGTSALIYVDTRRNATTIFDYVHTPERPNRRGYKVFFAKDQRLNGMNSVSLIFEGSERMMLAEALAYDLYHQANCPAPLAEFVRVSVDDRMQGYHLMVERINRSFLRRNELDDNGNLYKLLWFGGDVTGQHAKRTHPENGHADLLDVIRQLEQNQSNPARQWQIIQTNFDADEVAGYFAVNMVLSHWDGFFNNYFVYHDTARGKWQMYPWDQDKTWGYHDGLSEEQTFYNMPLTFGMTGSRPPGGGDGGGWGGANGWWRPPGFFSGPLLANPQFRKLFLERTSKILREAYTEERFNALIDQYAQRLQADVILRGQMRGQSPGDAKREYAAYTKALKEHLAKRRQFLLSQKELSTLAKPAGN